MVAVGAATIAFFIYLTSRLSTPDMTLLYADLDPQDSGQIVSRLEQQDIGYRLGPDGSQIFVPSDQVARLRVVMAVDGLPSGGSIGYEIFDRSEGLGTTKFVQNVNHLRALEGELARTIRSISRVKHARVHLVLPKRELFTRDRQEPTASIVLTTQGNQRLAKQQVLAIQHLVAAAVPGLQPAMVSIVDSNGALLARGSDEDDSTGAASTAEEMRIAYQSRLAHTIEEILERSVGPGNVRAQVTAEMDFDRVTENSEIFDPDGQVVRSTQTIEEQSGSSDAQGLPPVTVGGNLPDANLPGADGAASSSNAQRNEETVNYEISKTIKTHVRESGVVRRHPRRPTSPADPARHAHPGDSGAAAERQPGHPRAAQRCAATADIARHLASARTAQHPGPCLARLGRGAAGLARGRGAGHRGHRYARDGAAAGVPRQRL